MFFRCGHFGKGKGISNGKEYRIIAKTTISGRLMGNCPPYGTFKCMCFPVKYECDDRPELCSALMNAGQVFQEQGHIVAGVFARACISGRIDTRSVFSYLEGRRNTELLGAGMSASFIISSGLVKSIGKYMVDGWQISEYWMPFLIGLMFVPLLLTGIWMLERTPQPDEADIGHRSGRMQMDKQSRLALFSSFSFGIVLVVGIYIALTIFRDIRDNFAVEIWAFLGQTDVASLLFWSEVPIALFVFTIIALMMYIRDNRVAFYSNLGIILLGGVILVFGTLLFSVALIGPVFWMIIVGFAMYLAYISYHTMLFERWFAHFRCTGNLGFFMYLADSFGYLGSLSVLLIKNFGGNSTNWLDVLIALSYIVGGATLILGGIAYLYFLDKEKKTEMGTLSISTAQKTF